VCGPGEAIEFVTCGGGGFGEPRKRDAMQVAAAVNRRWVSPERAEQVYGVKLRLAGNGIDYLVDEEGTNAVRAAP
jgi:N-methylhydantoinase B